MYLSASYYQLLITELGTQILKARICVPNANPLGRQEMAKFESTLFHLGWINVNSIF